MLLDRTTFAQSYEPFNLIEPASKSELWLNPGMYSYHYDKSQNFNDHNFGFGGEYKFSTIASLTVGEFRNSDNAHSKYVGIYWEPIAIGPVNFGLVGGGFNGYPATNNGGWFPALFPAATIEGDWIGANIFFIPTVGDKVHGAISLQLKIKVMD